MLKDKKRAFGGLADRSTLQKKLPWESKAGQGGQGSANRSLALTLLGPIDARYSHVLGGVL